MNFSSLLAPFMECPDKQETKLETDENEDSAVQTTDRACVSFAGHMGQHW